MEWRFKLDQHPCYNADGKHEFGRIHLPVAPRCNIQCNYCNRKFDCVNESRPGVTSSVLSAQQALAYLDEMLVKVPQIKVVGIAGPGDPFANPDETMQTLRLVREKYPDMMLCLASNGLNIAPYIDEIHELEVSHVTITMNAVDPKIGAIVYKWIRDDKTPMRGEAGAALIMERQLEAVRRLAEKGVLVKVNSIIIPGVNDEHIPEIAKKVKELGATVMNCIPLCPVEDTGFAHLTEPDNMMVLRTRLRAGEHLKQMSHCARCRADAVGLLEEDLSGEYAGTLERYKSMPLVPDEDRPYVAVASEEGMLVNLHLGEASEVLIYREVDEDEFEVMETRKLPEPGGGNERWSLTAELLKDCRAFLVSASGPTPKRILESYGLKVLEMEGLIEEGLEAVFAGNELPASLQRRFIACGISCQGSGTGCG